MSRRPKKGEVGVDADKLRGFVVTSGDDCDAARRLSRKHPALSSSMSVRLGSSLRKEVSFATLRCLRTERPKPKLSPSSGIRIGIGRDFFVSRSRSLRRIGFGPVALGGRGGTGGAFATGIEEGPRVGERVRARARERATYPGEGGEVPTLESDLRCLRGLVGGIGREGEELRRGMLWGKGRVGAEARRGGPGIVEVAFVIFTERAGGAERAG